ncbi:aminotransferase [Umbelopsis sp. PMI_123]|nr:aminotransferase [Umbelopsis sp. PMI_123]
MQLLETILFEPENGCYLLDYHLDRLFTSAQYFNNLDGSFSSVPSAEEIKARLLHDIPQQNGPQRIRLLLSKNGELELQHSCLNESPPLCNIDDKVDTVKPLILALDVQSTHTQSPYVLNKTTQRDLYNAARDRLECDFHAGEKGREVKTFDVLLYNQNGEVTETSIANVAVEKEPGVWITPRLECGLLPGVFRRHLLETGQIQEGIIRVEMLNGQHGTPPRVRCFNSVRKVYDVRLITPSHHSNK